MKSVVNNQGEIIQTQQAVTVKTIDGVHYQLTELETKELANKERVWADGELLRKQRAVIMDRQKAYGSAEEQIEFLVENGVNALIERNMAIKAAFPKN